MTYHSKSLDIDTVEYIINMLKQEWYDLNNMATLVDETPRDIGIRLGKKCQIIKTINDLSNQKRYL